MTDNEKMREVWDAHDKARNKAWREEPGTFDTLDAFKAGAAWQAAQAEQSVPVVGDADCYDAGLLNDFGGGNVGWWQDYIRAELARAHEFYVSQMPTHSTTTAELERLREIENTQASSVAAIQFALQQGPECETFLRLWNTGEFDVIRKEWPECPDEVFNGADPLFKSTRK